MSIERKKEILRAAGECFSKYGYEKTTLDDISKIVGINKASFYYYFKNKEEIFKELITEEADQFIQNTIESADTIPTCKERILKWISSGFSYIQSNSILHQLSSESVRNLSPFLQELVNYSKDRGTEYLVRTLNYFSGNGEIKPIDSQITAATIQNIVYALKNYLQVDSKKQLSAEQKHTVIMGEVNHAVSLILDGIRAEKGE